MLQSTATTIVCLSVLQSVLFSILQTTLLCDWPQGSYTTEKKGGSAIDCCHGNKWINVFTGGWKVSDMGVCAVISMYLYTLTAVYAIQFWWTCELLGFKMFQVYLRAHRDPTEVQMWGFYFLVSPTINNNNNKNEWTNSGKMKESNQAERKADLCGLTEQQGRKKLRT